MTPNKFNILKYALFLCCVYAEAALPQATGEIDLNELDGNNGFVIPGVAANDFTGFAVSSAGDINADGLSDIIIGADGADQGGSGTGAAYVIFGSAQGFEAIVEKSDLDGSNGFVINTGNAGDSLGWSVNQLQDINADSIDDLMVCAPFADTTVQNEGICYVLFGRTSGFPASFNVSSLNGVNGFKIKGAIANGYLGMSNSSAGDFNADGIADVLMATDRSSFYVLFGRDDGFAAEIELSGLNGNNGFEITGPPGGGVGGIRPRANSNAGDINNDNIDDMILGLPDHGIVYVIFGHSGDFQPTLDVSELNGSNGFSIDEPLLAFGLSVSDAGDLNHDGKDDLIIGSWADRAYVIFGHEPPFNATVDLDDLNGNNGFSFTNANVSENAGFSVSYAGDLNGDGYDDVMIGTDASRRDTDHGVGGYVFYGHENIFPATVDLSTLTVEQGFKILSLSSTPYTPGQPYYAGVVTNSVHDINGDGINDLIYGQQGANLNGDFSGGAAVMFGRENDLIFKHGFESIQQ